MVTGLTSPQGTRGTEKGEKRVGGIKRGNRFKEKKRLKRDGKTELHSEIRTKIVNIFEIFF